MTRRRTAIICLALAAAEVNGYVPSKHPASKKVDIDKIVTEIVESSDEPLSQTRKPLRLEPIFDVNPLEKLAIGAATRGASPPALDPKPEKETTEVSRRESKQALFVTGSSALAAFTDVFTLAKFGCFVNMCTGNLLKATTGVAGGKTGEAILHASFVFSYIMGVALFNTIKRKCAEDDDALSLVAPIIIILFIGADVVSRSWGGSIKALQVPCLTCGFGLVNSASGHATGGTIFFALTGHLSKVTNWMADGMVSRAWKLDPVTTKSIRVVSSFIGGGLVAALVQRHLTGLVPLPVCTTLGLLYGTLFGWYAPTTPLLRRKLESSKVGQKIVRFGRLVKPAFASIRRPKQEPATESPNPVVVELFHAQDLLQPSNATINAFGY